VQVSAWISPRPQIGAGMARSGARVAPGTLLVSAACMAGLYSVAFVAAPGGLVSHMPRSAELTYNREAGVLPDAPLEPIRIERSVRPQTSVAVGVAAFAAAATAVVASRASRSGLTARPAKDEKSDEGQSEKEPFDVWNPQTYGNITMDDVKKYGTAGTVSYVLTELIFWVVALPTEVFTFYNIEGRWPDWSDGADEAAVLGFVFAASNIARLLLPLRFGAALALAPWVDANIMARLPGRSDAK